MRTVRWIRLAAALVPLVVAAAPPSARGCDICAIYTATELQESRVGLRLGVAEQFTRFATLQQDGRKIANPAGERLESSITQLLFGYAWSPQILLQLNVPVIHRNFRRLSPAGRERDQESGLGDVSLHVFATLLHSTWEASIQRLSVSLGIEFPTGSPRRLREELADHEEPSHPEVPPIFRAAPFWPRHGLETAQSGIHGHDVVLGSGSTDLIFGGQWLGTYRRLYGTLLLQYFLRTEGSYDYTFADETIFSGGPGLFLWTAHRSTLGLQSLFTLHTKGTDTLRGERVGDTGATFVYVGPATHWTWRTNLSADVAVEVPILQNTTSVQIVPDLRVRGGLVWRF
ncbi:hypothetical protein HRbin30_00265 [bacterium HR30]|nr:hypothetical protein HRbin30_00265 [bacterium HR30]